MPPVIRSKSASDIAENKGEFFIENSIGIWRLGRHCVSLIADKIATCVAVLCRY
jgi:hypothetical protein